MIRAAVLLVLSSLLSRRALAQDGCGDLSADPRIVSTSQEASALTADLSRCPGLEFNVFWTGSTILLEPMQLWNSTILRVTSLGASPVLDGGGQQQLFVVSDKGVLHVEGMGLMGGQAENGAVVAASGEASVTFVDCDVYGNKASSNGGAVFLDGGSSFTGAGVNFTGNSAEVYGGVIHAQNASMVTTQAGTSNHFHNNTARLGGAIHVQDGSNITFGSGGNVTLSSNFADLQGGAVHLERSCVLKTGGTTWVMDNQAGNSGGGVWAGDGSEVVATGNTTFLGNSCQNYGGAVMVSANAAVRTREDTQFANNYALNDGGAIQAEFSCRIQIAGRTLFQNNTVGNFGGAVNAYDGVTITTVGETKYIGNTAEEGGALYADLGVTAILAGRQLFERNSAGKNGGAIHLSLAESVTISGQPTFYANSAVGGLGGAIYSGSVPQITVKNANFTRNRALWGGAVASLSSGGSASSGSSALEPGGFPSSASDYVPSDLTPSLTTEGEGTTVTSLIDSAASGAVAPAAAGVGAGSGGGDADVDADTDRDSDDADSGSSSPAKYLDCLFAKNRASEDGGAIYSLAGFDLIRGCHFLQNIAASSGGALVHAGVMEEVSDTVFEGNRAGNEGPAVLSLGLLNSMGVVTFDSNGFLCEEGKFSTENGVGSGASTGKETCRFARVCSRCASECDSELESEVTVLDAATLPVCRPVPKGSKTTSRGGTLATLELLPGFYRSSETSTDVAECFRKDACVGGIVVGDYCASGHGGPYCAVCTEGYSPGYAHTCKSCMGGSKRRALAAISAIALVALVAGSFLVAKLVAVVETGPPSEEEQRWWQRRCSGWQARMKKTVPLTAVKIVVVVWQIVTQYSDVAGVKYPGAYNDFLAMVDVVNLDLGFILSLACVVDTDFYDRLLVTTVAPAVVLCLLGCTYLVARCRNQHSDEAIGVVQRRHLSVALFVLFVVYATVSYTVFETFVCDPLDDGNSYLRADYSLTCGTSLHTAYRVYAGLMILVYPVGVPCVFGWWLFKYRHELREEGRDTKAELRPLADLWEPYKRKNYYYEVVECFRRIALTGFAVFIVPDSAAQISIVLLLAAAFMVVSEILAPFARPVEMWLYRTGHYVVFASMYLALLLRVDVSEEQNRSQEVFSGVIVIAHAAMLLVVVTQGLLIFIGWGDLVEAPGALTTALDREETPGVFKSSGFSHNESDRGAEWAISGGPRDVKNRRGYPSGSAAGAKPWPTSAPAWGGGRGGGGEGGAEEESKRQTPSGKKGFKKPDRDSYNSKKGGGRMQETKKKWEKPLQKAKSSLFSSPAIPGRQFQAEPGSELSDKWKSVDVHGGRKEGGKEGYLANLGTSKRSAAVGGKGDVSLVKAGSSWAYTPGAGGGGAAALSVYPKKPSRNSLGAARGEHEAAPEGMPKSRSMSPKRRYRDRSLAAPDPPPQASTTTDRGAAILDGVSVGAGGGFRSSGGTEKRWGHGEGTAVDRSSTPSTAAAADAASANASSRASPSARVGSKSEAAAMSSKRPLGSDSGGGGGGWSMNSNPITSSSKSMATTEYNSDWRPFGNASSNASGATSHRHGRPVNYPSPACPTPSPDTPVAATSATPASTESTSSKGFMARRFWVAGGRSCTAGVEVFPTGTPAAAAPRRRSRSPRAREECPPPPTDWFIRRAERTGGNLYPPAPDGPPTMRAEKSSAPSRESRRAGKSEKVGGGSMTGSGKRANRGREGGGGTATGGSAGMWATAPHAPSTAPASAFATTGSGGGAAAAASTDTQRRSFDIYATNPASRRRRLNMQVVLSPTSSSLSGVSSSMLGMLASAPSTPAPSATQGHRNPPAATSASKGQGQACAGVGRDRGREAARPATTRPQFSTAGLFGSKAQGADEAAPRGTAAGAATAAPATGSGTGSNKRRARLAASSGTAGGDDDPRNGSSRPRGRSTWVPGVVGTGQRGRATSPMAESRRPNTIGDNAATLFPEEDVSGVIASHKPLTTKQRREKNILASAKNREKTVAAAAAAATGQGGSGGGGDDPYAPKFTRDFRSLSSSSIGGDSSRSFGGLGGGGGGYGGYAKASFFPHSLAPFCPSPAGVAAAATARGWGGGASGASSRGSGRSGFSGIVRHKNNGSRRGGGGHDRNASNADSSLGRGGLLERSRKDVLDFYRNGNVAERGGSFEAEIVYNRPFPNPVADRAAERKGARDGAGAGADAKAN